MSGYVFATAPCFGCRALFTFNPELVPSVNYNGDRRPICQTCVDRVNPSRIKNGLAPIVPLVGAYEPSEA